MDRGEKESSFNVNGLNIRLVHVDVDVDVDIDIDVDVDVDVDVEIIDGSGIMERSFLNASSNAISSAKGGTLMGSLG